MSDYKRIHIGCVAVYKNHIIAVGYNINKTHPLQKKYNRYRNLEYDNCEPSPNLHAEMMCMLQIMEMDIDFRKVELYVYREDRKGNLANCRPCPACMGMIDRLHIKKIHYTVDCGFVDEKRTA